MQIPLSPYRRALFVVAEPKGRQPTSDTRQEAAARRDRMQHWVLRMGQGEEAALWELYRATKARIYGFVARMLNDPAGAEETALDIYMEAWTKAGSFDPRRASPMTWLFTIARTRTIDRMRQQRRRPRSESLPSEFFEPSSQWLGASELAAKGEDGAAVRRAIARLPKSQRTAILLTFFQGMSYAEAAQHLDSPKATVSGRLRAAFSQLRTLLKDELKEGSSS